MAQFVNALRALDYGQRKAFLVPVIELQMIDLCSMVSFVMEMFLTDGPHGGVAEGLRRVEDFNPSHIDDLIDDVSEHILDGCNADLEAIGGWSQNQVDALVAKLGLIELEGL